MASLTKTYNDGNTSDAIFIEFSKIFYRVSHVPLAHDPQMFGVVETILDILRRFLTGQTFPVKVGDASSQPAIAAAG